MSYLGNQPGVTNFVLGLDRFNGTGACTQFTLTRTTDDANALEVLVNSIQQDPINSYSVSGGLVTFTEAPSVGSNNIVVIYRSTATITFTNVTTAQINDGAVTLSKLASGLLPTANITAAFNTANASFLQANASFLRANTPDHIANSAAIYANGAFATANSAASYANSAFSTANTASTTATAARSPNRIINGDMRIDQRNAGANSAADDGYHLDRWKFNSTQNGKGTIKQNAGAVTPPAGFINYLGFTSNSAYSVLSTDTIAFLQNIEGFNSADLNWGTANAQAVTLSFLVQSSLTGTFGGAFENASVDRAYPFTYTISAANTWEQKTITVAGDTTGTWGTGNGVGIRVWFNLGAGATFSGTAGAWAAADYRSATGATSVVGTSGATFYITGVQLEKGSTATPFEFRSIGTELALCQRYAQPIGQGASGSISNSTIAEIACMFRTQMRANPTITFGGFAGASTEILQWTVGSLTATAVFSPGSYISTTGVYLGLTTSGATGGKIAGIITGDVCFASAEL